MEEGELLLSHEASPHRIWAVSDLSIKPWTGIMHGFWPSSIGEARRIHRDFARMVEHGEGVMYSWPSTRPRTAEPAVEFDTPLSATPGGSIPGVRKKRKDLSYAWRSRRKSRF